MPHESEPVTVTQSIRNQNSQTRSRGGSAFRVGLLFAVAWLLGLAVAARYYSLPIYRVPQQLIKVIVTPLYAFVYRSDLDEVARLTSSYRVGRVELFDVLPEADWRRLENSLPGFRLVDMSRSVRPELPIPFIYEQPDQPYLRSLRSKYKLERMLEGKADEYAAMLALVGWLGTRWDHGSDPLIGTSQVCDPSDVIAEGEQGAKYWCEIVARTTVHAAQSVGWVGRVITGSSDGYTWEHAVAELWSNQFNKWIALDTDFNVVFESDGIPLSAFELSRFGPTLQRQGRLMIHRFAPAKPSMQYHDLIPFYKYVHVDLRNDWCSRYLHAGSPAGGDLATWWTARQTMHPVLTAKIRMDDPDTFDWKINAVAIHPLRTRPVVDDRIQVDIGLVAYSPMFTGFEYSVDAGRWTRLDGDTVALILGNGEHVVRARVTTRSGYPGPVSEVRFNLAPDSV